MLSRMRWMYRALFYPFRPKQAARKRPYEEFPSVRFVANTGTPRQVSRSILRILTQNELCAMASATPSGEPHIHTAFFTFDTDCRLYFLSDPTTQHCINIQQHRKDMAVAIASSDNRWGASLRGLQMWGHCEETAGTNADTANSLYGSDFPAFEAWFGSLTPLERESFGSRFYVFSPMMVKVLDEDEFGEETYVTAHVERS